MVTAVGFESRRLGLSVDDIDSAMRRQCTYLNAQARKDIHVQPCYSDMESKNCVLGHGYARKQFVIYVKPVAMVDGNGDWGGDGMHELNSM